MASALVFLVAALVFAASGANAQVIVNGQLSCGNGTGTPAAGTAVNLACNGIGVGVAITSISGIFSMIPSTAVLPTLLPNCTVTASAPVVGCVLQSLVTGLVAPVVPTAQNITIGAVNFVMAIAGRFAAIRIT